MPVCSKSRPGSHADHHNVAAQIRVIAEHLRHKHASLLVWFLVDRAGKEHTQVVACRLVSHGRALDLHRDPSEFRLRQQVDASFLASCHHHAGAQLAAELRRQCHTSFGVDFRSVGAQQQWRQARHHAAGLSRVIVGDGFCSNVMDHYRTSFLPTLGPPIRDTFPTLPHRSPFFPTKKQKCLKILSISPHI